MRRLVLAGIVYISCLCPIFAQETTTQPEQQPATVMPIANSGDFDAAMKLYRQKRYQAAVEEFQKVVAADPKNAAGFYFMGYAHYVMKHHTEAMDAFAKAFAADPNFDPRPYFHR